MRAIVLMFDSLNRHMLSPYAQQTLIDAPNFARLASKSVTFDNFYAGSMPCMPARREMHTGRYNFLHRSWGPLEPFDDSMPEMLSKAGVHTHLISDHHHYWSDGGATFHTRYSTWENFRGQVGDRWKGVVDNRVASRGPMHRQNRVNRSYMPDESTHVQTLAVDAGLHFLETNVEADQWMLQLELFDPHEPFFSHQHYRDSYGLEPEEEPFDWPAYGKVTEDHTDVEHARKEYAALVSMCDKSLGRVLDFMDEHHMWDDTMLIVNTDHGYMLGERGWWAKNVQPWFNELVHLPFFLWDPRHGGANQRCDALAQTIDLAPTLLSFFDVTPTDDMQGQDLGTVLSEQLAGHEVALWGMHGGHVNITDGRYVYMRGPETSESQPLEEFTLMPTHMRSRFSPEELADWEPAAPFSFTKGLRTMRTTTQPVWNNSWHNGTCLYDLSRDPEQTNPIVNDEVELQLAQALVNSLRDTDAPLSQFARMGLPVSGPVARSHLRVAESRHRNREMSVPLPDAAELRQFPELFLPLTELFDAPKSRAVLEQKAAELVHSELISASPRTTLMSLAQTAKISTHVLRDLGEALRLDSH